MVDLQLAQKHFIYVAPSPVLARLKRLHDGMLCLMKMFGCVPVLGRITAANMAADEALSQVDPGIAHQQAFLAAFAARLDVANFFYVWTSCLFVRHASLRESSSVQAWTPRLHYCPCSSRNFSTSSAAMHPLPAAVIAWR